MEQQPNVFTFKPLDFVILFLLLLAVILWGISIFQKRASDVAPIPMAGKECALSLIEPSSLTFAPYFFTAMDKKGNVCVFNVDSGEWVKFDRDLVSSMQRTAPSSTTP